MLLELDDLTKVFRDGTRANDGITLQVEESEVFGLLGPNGAGKTTLVSQLLGLLKPTSGSIILDGVDVIARPSFARSSSSYQPQATVGTTGLTALQAIELCGRIRGGTKSRVRQRGRDLLEALDLTEWESRTTPLSGGVARLVAFCMAAVEPGRLVILDEPTNDVDPLRRRLLWREIRALADAGAAVLLVTHNVLEAERCVDRLAVIDHGKVVGAGSPAALKTAIGGDLRFEVTVEPGLPPVHLPEWAVDPAPTGRRVMARIAAADATAAVEWSTRAQAESAISEFSLSPASLEDVYVRLVDGDAP
jgi:ABC-2 type transport system ATP-binding protein